jgi:glucose/arabinose dehydrogenase
LRVPKLLIAAILVMGAIPTSPVIPGRNPVAASVPEAQGFQVTTVWSGLDFPTALAFASTGRVFVAELGGTIQTFDGLGDTSPTQVIDLSRNVHAAGDRGLLGLAAHPNFAANPFLYVAYTLDAPPGGSAPFYNDGCPNFPEGCPAVGRVSRIRIGADGRATGGEEVIIGGPTEPYWCHQQRGHAIDHLAFGPDGALYISSGEGASGAQAGGDWGQQATGTGGRTPRNACGDPPGAVGDQLTLPTTEGGALRSQDLLTDNDPAQGSGAIVRVDPVTGDPLPDNPLVGVGNASDDRHVAFGLRNPYRFTFRPGTDEIWVADVGWNTWEEINRIPEPTDATVENFGWPCYEGGSGGSEVNAVWNHLGANLCEQLYAGQHGPVARPYWSYRHSSVPGSPSCANAGSAVSGIAFVPPGSFSSTHVGGLLIADYVKACIWLLPRGSNGLPSTSGVQTLVSDVQALDLEFGPDGAAYFVDLNGTVERLAFFGSNQPPQARISATPTFGPLPLEVDFSGSASTDDGGPSGLSYAWDLDGDGAFDDASGVQATRTYTQAVDVTVRLRVTDAAGASAVATQRIQPGATPPTARIDQPATGLRWATGDTISFAGSATDAQETLGPSSMRWDVVLFHCQTQSDCHQHPLVSRPGVDRGSFLAPEHAYPAYLELRLTVTDSRGMTATATRRLDPRTVDLTFSTQPAGLRLTAGFQEGTAPITVRTIVGSGVSVTAPAIQVSGSTRYVFDRWSDGGARTHDVVAGGANRTVVAHYVAEGISGGGNVPFVDIGGHPFETDIGWAYLAGITGGCATDPMRFCPDRSVTRGQMASFLVRALRLPGPSGNHFTDDNASVHSRDIDALFEAGITVGCTATRFCPDRAVKRDEMASFLVRAFELPAPSADHFRDDERSVHERDIDALFEAGITRGCTATTYCPGNAVRRGEMTAFLHRALRD